MVRNLLDKQWARVSSSPYSSPILFIQKKDGSLRCVLVIEVSMLWRSKTDTHCLESMIFLTNCSMLSFSLLWTFSPATIRSGFQTRISQRQLSSLTRACMSIKCSHLGFPMLQLFFRERWIRSLVTSHLSWASRKDLGKFNGTKVLKYASSWSMRAIGTCRASMPEHVFRRLAIRRVAMKSGHHPDLISIFSPLIGASWKGQTLAPVSGGLMQ